MGCFLACFGFKKKKKKKNRRKSAKESPSGEQNNLSYVPLDSDASIKENFISESHQQREKPKKKVSFNLNVKAYEPIPHDDDNGMHLSECEEETKWELNWETKNMASLHYEEDKIASNIPSCPVNYRYQNCRDSYDELKLDEDDLYFDENEDTDEEADDVCSNESDDVVNNNIPDEKNTSLENLPELQRLRGQDRSQYVLSVLNPVENLTQWMVVKAKAAKMHSKCQKENLISKHEDGYDSLAFKNMRNSNLAVDASLSNWLGTL